MHELSLIGSVLRIVEEQAVAENFQRVISVCLGVGELSNVQVEALVFCFGIATRGSLAHNARLCIHTISRGGMVREMQEACSYCLQNRRVSLLWDLGTFGVTDGDQITVRELEVE